MATAKPQTAFLATSAGTAGYTVTAGLGTGGCGNVKEVLLLCVSTGTCAITVYAVPASGSPANSNMILNAVSIGTNTTLRIPFDTMLEPSAYLWFVSNTQDNMVKVQVSALEFGPPTVLVPQTPGLLQVTANTYYTATVSTVGNPKEIILCNTSTGTVTATLYVVPPSGSTSNTTAVLNAASLTGCQTLILPFNTDMTAGGTIQALASSANAISIRVSAAEYS